MTEHRAQPPKWADKLLEWYCSEKYLEETLGDLHEWFDYRVDRQGAFKARLLYFLDVIKLFRSYRLKGYREIYTNSYNNNAMFKNYLITSWRSLLKSKVFSLINILGLAIGMSACLLILLYVRHELSYDQFQANKENVFRIKQDRYNKGELTTSWASGCAGIGPALAENFPEVKDYVKLTQSNAVVTYKDQTFKEDYAYYATSSFFNFFSIPLLQGVDSLVLKDPYTVVLSESTAKKYFGEEDPIGKTIRHNGARDFDVTGVYADIPANSHMEADMLFSFETYVDLVGEGSRTNWDWDGFMTYIWLDDNVVVEDFESKLPAFVIQQHGEELEGGSAGIKFTLQAITDIHLYSDFMMEFKANGDGQVTYFLLIIAIFIILIAWVNYINLATAKSMERAKEVGIRKVMGSFRNQLMNQFFIEAIVLNLFAAVLALVLIYLALPYFNQLSGRELLLSFADPQLWAALVVLFVFGGLLSGIYPAVILSGFKPVSVLKGKIRNSAKGAFLRKGMVIFQFFASLVLMVGTYTVFEQLNHMRDQRLGVNVEQTLVVKGPNITDSLYSDKLNLFKNSLVSYSQINSVTASTAVPGAQPDWNAGGIRLVEEDRSQSNQYRVIGMDYDFIEAYGLEVIEGRSFEKERSTDENTVLMNESGARLIGFDNLSEAINRDMYFWGDTFKIVGVVKNYHQESLKKSFEPLVFRLIPNSTNYYSIKVNNANLSGTIEQVEKEWNALFPGNPFNFFFLDDHFEKQYKADVQFGRVFGLFAGLAIFIACLGLFGLASYMTMQRTKEVGVRKVLGASMSSILTLLSKDFIKLILFASVFAIPLSWWVMSQWLNSFAYQMNLAWWVFAVPAVTLLIIALVTVSFQTLKAALTNPVESLRNE